MPNWLSDDDLRAQLGLEPTEGDGIRLGAAVNAAMEQVEVRTGQSFTEGELPARVRLATLLQAARLYKRQEATFGIAQVGTVDGGTGMRLLAKLDPDAEALLADYVNYDSL